MSSALRSVLCAVVLLLVAPSCLQVDHFEGDPRQYDGLYFGPAQTGETTEVRDDKWRGYALWGLVAWSRKNTEWAGRRLAQSSAADRPQRIVVRTRMSPGNALVAAGMALFVGPFQGLIYEPRSTEVRFTRF